MSSIEDQKKAKGVEVGTKAMQELAPRAQLQAESQKMVEANPDLPLVAWVPDFRIMKDSQTGEPIIDPETNQPQLGYIPVMFNLTNDVFLKNGIRLMLLTPD